MTGSQPGKDHLASSMRSRETFVAPGIADWSTRDGLGCGGKHICDYEKRLAKDRRPTVAMPGTCIKSNNKPACLYAQLSSSWFIWSR